MNTSTIGMLLLVVSAHGAAAMASDSSATAFRQSAITSGGEGLILPDPALTTSHVSSVPTATSTPRSLRGLGYEPNHLIADPDVQSGQAPSLEPLSGGNPVPLPGPGLLGVAGLATVAALRRRRKD